MIKKLLSRITAFVALFLCIGFSAKARQAPSYAVEIIYNDESVMYTDKKLSDLPTSLNTSNIVRCNILVDPELDRNDFFRIGGSQQMNLERIMLEIATIRSTIRAKVRTSVDIGLALLNDADRSTSDNVILGYIKLMSLACSMCCSMYGSIGISYNSTLLEKHKLNITRLYEIFYRNFLTPSFESLQMQHISSISSDKISARLKAGVVYD